MKASEARFGSKLAKWIFLFLWATYDWNWRGGRRILKDWRKRKQREALRCGLEGGWWHDVLGEHQGTMSRWTQLSLLSPVVSLSSLSVWVKMTNVWAMEILSNIFPCPSHSSLLVMGHCKPLGIETKEIVTLLGCHRGVNRTLPLDYDRAKRDQHRTSGKLPLGTGQW